MTQTQENPAFFASIRVLRLAWLCAALLVVAALALNLKVIDFGFLYLRDDDVNVALNPNMGGLGADRIAWMFTDAVYARRYIPLGWLNFAATYQFAGLDPRPYHTVALVLFLTNAGLVFAILLEVLRCFAPAARMGGLPYIVEEGKSGLLFEAGNVGELAQRIQDLANDPASAVRMGAHARKLSETKYGPEQGYSNLMKIFSQVQVTA